MTKKTGSLRRLLRFLRPHLRPNRGLVVGGFAAMFIEVAVRVIEPWPLKFVIDAVVAPGAAADSGIVVLLAVCAVAVLAAAGIRALAAYFMTVCFALAGTRTMNTVRGRVYAHALRLSLRFHNGSRAGDLINRLVSDVGKMRDVAVTAAMPLIGNCVTLVAMFTVMMFLDWRLGLVILAAFPIFLLFSHVSSRRVTRAARVQRAREGDLAGAASESFSAMKLVQAYTLEPVLESDFASSNSKELREGVRATRLAAGLERTTDVLVGVATGAVLLIGGMSVVRGHLTPGELVVFVQYLKGAFKPMRDLAKYTGRIAKALASGERVLALLEERPEVTDGTQDLGRPSGRVSFRGVAASYDDETVALENVELDVLAGERVALVGHSGSGKSTLASLVLRLQDPSEGVVEIDGRDIRDCTLSSVRAATSIVLQESVLFAGTVRDNIRMGRPTATDEHVAWAADVADVTEFAERLPDGLDTVVGERGDTLSGGQRQRIAIARAILRDARIVILDEPTSGLDATSAGTVTDALDRLTAGKTTLIVTHDLEDALSCDRIVVLERGRIVEQGTPEELLGRDASRLSILNRSADRAAAGGPR
ncbi:protein-tyrosine-phosphatase [Microbacterium faecale]|uniref:Protein-tyrosine-phosphatase n=1 Tax=Microbacterium faecale TaxID=1804630 RepID=A0A916YEL3_9MICO|nr:ABC transporter ATP-binding protein [Microbacterium faecale]GGD40373.1 protein-tyrosine-phosphatase [Microbacterium faecale]